MREEETLCPSNEYHNDGTGSPETNIYLSGAHVTVPSSIAADHLRSPSTIPIVHSVLKTNSRLKCKNRYPIYYHNGGKMAIIDTLFMTKTAEKPYPLGPHIPI